MSKILASHIIVPKLEFCFWSQLPSNSHPVKSGRWPKHLNLHHRYGRLGFRTRLDLFCLGHA